MNLRGEWLTSACSDCIVTPSPEELATAKERVRYMEDHFHFAIAGVSGSGKSSLVNAFRGLRSKDVGAAAVGITETTLQMTRYPEANPKIPFVWYDVPGAGASIFLPTSCAQKQHIWNLMIDMGYDSETDEGPERHDELFRAARLQLIEETRNTVKANLVDANLPDQRVYVVSNATLLDLVRKKMPKKTIDEVELLNDLYSQAHARRSVRLDDVACMENLVDTSPSLG